MIYPLWFSTIGIKTSVSLSLLTKVEVLRFLICQVKNSSTQKLIANDSHLIRIMSLDYM